MSAGHSSPPQALAYITSEQTGPLASPGPEAPAYITNEQTGLLASPGPEAPAYITSEQTGPLASPGPEAPAYITNVSAGGIVLCGGQSTRMGTSKALLPFGPETMLQRVVRLLGTVVSPLVVVAASGQPLPSLPPEVIVSRDEREARGPLEGLRAGLKALPLHVEIAYVTSCDVPLLVTAFVRRMIDLVEGHDIAVMEIDGFPHPLSAVYRRDALPHVEDLLAQDKLRPIFLFDRVRTRRVSPAEMLSVDPELQTLRNLNTREDYQEALARAGHQSPPEL